MNKVIENRMWRYATKKFDSTKLISDEHLAILIETARLSASSYGLQPYHIFVITDIAIREKLKPVSWGQSQITDASHLLVFANSTNFDEQLVDDYLNRTAIVRDVSLESLSAYGNFMKKNIVNLPVEAKEVWAAKQVYLALGNVMQAAAELKIDSCPMEGLDAAAYDEILGLKNKELTTTLALPIGYRSSEDTTQELAKVRKTKETLFTYLK